MNTFTKLLIVYTRLVAMWLFVLGFNFWTAGNYISGVAEVALAAFLLTFEANWLVNGIESNNKE